MTPAPDLVDARPATLAAPGRAMPVATRLRDYEIAAVVAESALGIVYEAWDHSLQRKVAVKEYMPAALVERVGDSPAVAVRSERQIDAFQAGRKSFVDEARLLARFDHPSLVRVYRFWEENGTAYRVMPFYEGPTLERALAELGHVPSEGELRTWLRPVLNAISVLHEGAAWHQNIGPDEIVLTPVGPVLLGFAAAAHAIATAQHTAAAALKPGFAAIEQYGSAAGTTRGPWTDLYALAAVVYAAITGSAPAAAADRLVDDPVRPLARIAAGLYSDAFLLAVDAAMRVRPEGRPQDHLEFRALMGDIDAPEAPVSLAPRRDLMQEPFIGGVAGDREITVPDRPLLAPAGPALPPSSVAAATARPRPASPTGRDSGSVPLRGEASTPSWTKDARAGMALGKRALYGIVAVTCFLVGLVALVIQFTVRQAPPAATTAGLSASAAARASVPTGAVVGSTTPPPTPLPEPAPPAPVAVSVPLPAAAPPLPPTVALTPTTTPEVAVASGASAPTPSSDSGTPTERQARCIEILQKASLERISAADTEFFKKECR
jgi:serine/threonine protein kinase